MTSVSDKNEVILAPLFGENVDLYTEEGKRKMTLELPTGHQVRDVAFHLIVRKIIVLSSLRYPFFLRSYSETGKLENSMFLCKKEGISCFFDIVVKSHPSGPVAVVEKESITCI